MEEKMKVEYDPKHDIMNIEFLADEKIEESTEIDGIIFDYTRDKKIVAIEILDVSRRITPKVLDKIDFSIVKEKV
jgi:uncharacterized protein YuzE